MQRREFLKLAGAGGVAVMAARGGVIETAPAEIMQEAEPLVMPKAIGEELVIDLAGAYDFHLKTNNHIRPQLSVGSIEPVGYGLGRIDETLQVSIYADETARDWLFETMQANNQVRVIHDEIGLNRRMIVAEASLSVQDAFSDVLLELNGPLLA